MVCVLIGIGVLAALWVLGWVLLPSVIRMNKSKRAPVEQVFARLEKVGNETQFAPARIWFRVEGERKPRCFESRKSTLLHLPEPGTGGTLTCKGSILYSFAWDGGTVVQDQPDETGKTTYSDLI